MLPSFLPHRPGANPKQRVVGNDKDLRPSHDTHDTEVESFLLIDFWFVGACHYQPQRWKACEKFVRIHG